ncbi:MAG TPA: hypothetical protein PLD59_07530 [Tepidisphaeraceae bacterium]|mgnify:CR=1 FL=1|nr:hypothetical protein [Tepidisphaeraceae bacterium]
MARQDAYICDVIVIPTAAVADQLDGLISRLKESGLQVRDVHKDDNAIEGTIDAGHIRTMEKLDGVEYVRCVFSYIADYPVGDPRDVACSQN